mgnify:CR=1 FL=1
MGKIEFAAHNRERYAYIYIDYRVYETFVTSGSPVFVIIGRTDGEFGVVARKVVE